MKSYNMGTKNNPGKFDCYAKAAPDEPIFILRATDIIAPLLVEQWADNYEQSSIYQEGEKAKRCIAKVTEARKCAKEMRDYFTKLNGYSEEQISEELQKIADNMSEDFVSSKTTDLN